MAITTPEAITFNPDAFLGAGVKEYTPVEGSVMSFEGRRSLAALAIVGVGLGGALVGNTGNASATIESYADTRPDLYQVSEDTASSAVETTTSTTPVEECIDDSVQNEWAWAKGPEGSNHWGPAPEKMYETPQEAYLNLIDDICGGSNGSADALKTVRLADYFDALDKDLSTEESTALAVQLTTDKDAWNDVSNRLIDKMNEYDIALETPEGPVVYETEYMKDTNGDGIPESYKSTEDMENQTLLTFIHKEAKGEDGKNIVKRLKINCDWQPVDIDLPELSKLPPKGGHKTPTTKPGETTTTKPGEETTTTSTSTTTSTPESTTTTTIVPPKNPPSTIPSTTVPEVTETTEPPYPTTSTTMAPETTLVPSTIPNTSTTLVPPTSQPPRP
jgi:hypothetical protein